MSLNHNEIIEPIRLAVNELMKGTMDEIIHEARLALEKKLRTTAAEVALLVSSKARIEIDETQIIIKIDYSKLREELRGNLH